jgi:transposase
VTGLAIIRAILKGERDLFQLAKLRDYRSQASEEEIARSLEGNWQEDVLFELQQAVEAYDFCQKQIGDCDRQLQKYLAALPDRTIPQPRQPKPAVVSGEENGPKRERGAKNRQKNRSKQSKSQRNQPKFDLESELTRTCGVNLKSIDGVDVMTIATFISELGTDMAKWKDEDHLVSWLKLSPRWPVSGGKVIKKQERLKVKNRAAEAL